LNVVYDDNMLKIKCAKSKTNCDILNFAKISDLNYVDYIC